MIDFLPDTEQQQIVDAVATVLTERFPLGRHRTHGPGGTMPAAVWNEISELGWFGLGLSEELGGVGYSVREDVLVARECGRQLAPMSILGSILGARIAAQAGDIALVADIVTGTNKVALALPVDFSAGTPSGATFAPEAVTGRWLVIDGNDAAFVAGWSETHAFLIPSGCHASSEAQHSLDWTVDSTLLEYAGALPRLSTDAGNIARLASLLCAAMLSGIAEATRDMAVGYAKEREQFGQPIGAFQSIKHLCADMALRCEAASSQVLYAAVAERDEVGDRSFHVSAAKLLASNAALQNAATNIQIHGGMGFTAECDAHLYLKRAHLLDQLGGAQRRHQDALARSPLGARALRRGAA